MCESFCAVRRATGRAIVQLSAFEAGRLRFCQRPKLLPSLATRLGRHLTVADNAAADMLGIPVNLILAENQIYLGEICIFAYRCND